VSYDTEDLTDCAGNASVELACLCESIAAGGVDVDRMGDARAIALRLQRDLPMVVELVGEFLAKSPL